jgi:hypothetical protein
MPEPTYRIRRIYSRKVKGITRASQGTLDAVLNPKSAVDNFCSGKDLSFEEDSRH